MNYVLHERVMPLRLMSDGRVLAAVCKEKNLKIENFLLQDNRDSCCWSWIKRKENLQYAQFHRRLWLYFKMSHSYYAIVPWLDFLCFFTTAAFVRLFALLRSWVKSEGGLFATDVFMSGCVIHILIKSLVTTDSIDLDFFSLWHMKLKSMPFHWSWQSFFPPGILKQKVYQS